MAVLLSKPVDTLDQASLRSPATESRHFTPGASLEMAVYPNPFTGQVMIDYGLQAEAGARLSLRIFNVAGRQLYTVFKDQVRAPGEYQSTFDGDVLPAGVYWFELTSDKGLKTVKKAVKTKI